MSQLSAEHYTELQALLQAAGALCDAAEAHGTLSGLICIHGSHAGEHWLETMLPAPPEGDVLAAERRERLVGVAEENASRFEDPGFPFQLVLPDDAEPMSRRAAALAHWAQGFLHGLADAGSRAGLAERLQAEPLAELLQDLGEITRAVGGQEEDAETDEQAYAELVEYLRVAAQLFYLELAPLRADRHEAPGRLQ